MRANRGGVLASAIALVTVFVGAIPTAASAAEGAVLAETGLAPETFLWAGIGAAVLIVGGVLVVLSRRRSKDD